MSALIRPRQRVLTAIFPHNANRRYLIPKRSVGPALPESIFVMTVGSNATPIYGWETTLGIGALVSGTPNIDGLVVDGARTGAPGSNTFRVNRFQATGITTITVTLDALTPWVATFSGTPGQPNAGYSAVVAGIDAYMAGRVGLNSTVKLEW